MGQSLMAVSSTTELLRVSLVVINELYLQFYSVGCDLGSMLL